MKSELYVGKCIAKGVWKKRNSFNILLTLRRKWNVEIFCLFTEPYVVRIIYRMCYFENAFSKGYDWYDLKVLGLSLGKYFEKHIGLMYKYIEKWI